MKPKDSRQRLFEVMGRLDKTFKPKLNEYSNYPAGAEHDPRAPYNQVDDTLDYIEGQYSIQYPKSFNVMAHSADGKGTFSREGFEMIDDMIENGIENYTPEQQQAVAYFEQFRDGGLTDEIGKSQEFQGMVDLIWDATYGDERNFEWEYPDMYENDARTGDFSTYDAGDTAQSYEDDGRADMEIEANKEAKLAEIMEQIKNMGFSKFIRETDIPTLHFLFTEYNMPLETIKSNANEIGSAFVLRAQDRNLKVSDFVDIWVTLNGELGGSQFSRQDMVQVLRKIYKV